MKLYPQKTAVGTHRRVADAAVAGERIIMIVLKGIQNIQASIRGIKNRARTDRHIEDAAGVGHIDSTHLLFINNALTGGIKNLKRERDMFVLQRSSIGAKNSPLIT